MCVCVDVGVGVGVGLLHTRTPRHAHKARLKGRQIVKWSVPFLSSEKAAFCSLFRFLTLNDQGGASGLINVVPLVV